MISSEDKRDYCESLGARGCINRKDFDHWGMLPHWKDNAGYAKWLKGVRKFGAAFWEALGERRNPRIVFEHPGETTIPTSLFVCETGGMVVICAGTTGYNATIDLRYLWMRQKRVQGSHFANDEQANGVNQLVLKGLVDPCLSRTFTFEEVGVAHQLMHENKHPHGNMGLLVGATELGTGITESVTEAAERVPAAAGDTPEEELRPAAITAPSTPSPSYFFQQMEEFEPVIEDDGTLVKDVMNRGVISCAPDSSLEDVAALMIQNKIHAVVVMEDEKPFGVVTQTDMALARQGKTQEDARQITARVAMTHGCATCNANDTLTEAISKMTRQRIHRLVVLEDDFPVGVISMTDVVRKLIFRHK
jgi:crotonyl-CoA carboxylase/reductase